MLSKRRMFKIGVEAISRALYFLDRPKGQERLNVTKIVDGELTTRYIDLPKQ